MPRTQHPPPHRPHRPVHDVPDAPDPTDGPVGPDEGPVPPVIPEDAEHDRLVDPAGRQRSSGSTWAEAPSALPLPHERDESPASAAATPDPVIAQAKRDLDAGLVDTDMRATPGLDARRRARLVPGPGGQAHSGD